MNLTLPPDLESFVAQQVQEGQFASKDDVLIEGLRLLVERQTDRQAKLEDLRREIALGLDDLDNGRSVPLNQETLEGIKARGRARLQANGSSE
jgi:antitoxin ParD1/3/4